MSDGGHCGIDIVVDERPIDRDVTYSNKSCSFAPLSASLRGFADFLAIEPDLVAAATASRPKGQRRNAAGTDRLLQRQSAGVLTVSTSPNFASKWLVHRLGRFAEIHPTIDPSPFACTSSSPRAAASSPPSNRPTGAS